MVTCRWKLQRDEVFWAFAAIETKSSTGREDVLQSRVGREVAQETLAMSLETHEGPRIDLAMEERRRIEHRRKWVRLPPGSKAPSPCVEHPPSSLQQ